MYTWFHVYRPMGPDACPDLCLTPEQQLRGAQVRRRDAGEEADHHHRRLLRRRGPGAVPGGDRHHAPHQPVGRHRAVPDRAVHQASRSTRPRTTRGRCARSSCSRSSCATSASWPQSTTRGCIVLERPDLLKELVEKHGAKDATVRGTALAELEAMTGRGRRSTTPATRSRRRTGCTGWPSGSGSTTSASTAGTTTAAGRAPRC